jgi:HSP20 family protein
MKLHLDRWFKFARRHSDVQRDHTPELQHQQQGPALSSGQQMGGGAVTSRNDRGGLPDPFRTVSGMLRDPFASLSQIDRWFGDFSASAFEPRVDVVDDGDAIRITAEIPGVDRSDIHVDLEDEYLVLSGEKRLERRDEEQGAFRVERAFGTFQRVIPLPEGVDVERAEATFDNGTLIIRLPKLAQGRSGRRLDIGGSSTAAGSSSTGASGTRTGGASKTTAQQG